jgi:hypothetical protein
MLAEKKLQFTLPRERSVAPPRTVCCQVVAASQGQQKPCELAMWLPLASENQPHVGLPSYAPATQSVVNSTAS